MALTAIEDNGMIKLKGYYIGQTIPEFLGMKNSCYNLDPFYIGFDTRIKPATVRIFFDTEKAAQSIINSSQSYIGLIQLGEIYYNGIPIEPGIYSDDIKYRDWCDDFGGVLNNPIQWVDMVSKDVMTESTVYKSRCYEPFFQYNGVLGNTSLSLNDLCFYNYMNGSISYIPFQQSNNFCLASSLVSPIGLDFDGPYEDDLDNIIKRYMENGKVPISNQDIIDSDINSNGLVKLATNILQLEKEDILSVQTAGKFVLFQLADSEGYFIYLCSFILENGNGQKSLVTYLMDTSVIEEKMLDKIEELVTNFVDFKNKFRINAFTGLPYSIDSLPQYLGGNRNLDYLYKDKRIDPIIEIVYKTIAVQKYLDTTDNAYKYKTLGAIQWKVARSIELDTMSLGPLEITQPQYIYNEIYRFNLNNNAAIENYLLNIDSIDDRTGSPRQKVWFNNNYYLVPNDPTVYGNNWIK